MKKKDQVLTHIKKNPNEASGEIAKKLNIDPKNIGRYLKELETEGTITKEHKFKGNIRYNIWRITNRKNKETKGESKEQEGHPIKAKTTSINHKTITQKERIFLKDLIIRSTHRRVIKQDESKKALDILYK